jgi:hypothetical protein
MSKRSNIERTCRSCGKKFFPTVEQVNRGIGHCCSNRCVNLGSRSRRQPIDFVPLTIGGRFALLHVVGGVSAKIDIDLFPSMCSRRWFIAKEGYVGFNQHENGSHRAVLLHHLVLPGSPGMDRDHINRDKLDNRRENLRLVSRSINIMNAGPRRDNTSGIRGVSWNESRKRWRAAIQIDGKQVHLGRFKTLDEAAAARAAAERELGVLIA